ncbi:hypothetical protein [Acholeplasma hippikon]|uniref:hypothetical protein n=1 Tax=Acholeplasma hippikon TaxID=264636 RepID=UPI00054FDA06|nr:hypothetical protein [Acholeplasma hippikon]
MIILNSYIINLKSKKELHSDSISLFLGMKEKHLINQKILQHGIDYLIILTATYIINWIIITIVNLNLLNRFNFIFNILRNNIYIYLVPIGLVVLLDIFSYIQVILKVERIKILKNLS